MLCCAVVLCSWFHRGTAESINSRTTSLVWNALVTAHKTGPLLPACHCLIPVAKKQRNNNKNPTHHNSLPSCLNTEFLFVEFSSVCLVETHTKWEVEGLVFSFSNNQPNWLKVPEDDILWKMCGSVKAFKRWEENFLWFPWKALETLLNQFSQKYDCFPYKQLYNEFHILVDQCEEHKLCRDI